MENPQFVGLTMSMPTGLNNWAAQTMDNSHPTAGGESTYPGGFKHLSARLAIFTQQFFEYRVAETES